MVISCTCTTDMIVRIYLSPYALYLLIYYILLNTPHERIELTSLDLQASASAIKLMRLILFFLRFTLLLWTFGFLLIAFSCLSGRGQAKVGGLKKKGKLKKYRMVTAFITGKQKQ